MIDEPSPSVPLLQRMTVQIRERYKIFAAKRAANMEKLDFPALEACRQMLAGFTEQVDKALAVAISSMENADEVRKVMDDEAAKWKAIMDRTLDLRIDEHTPTKQ
jgi:hypothetical protein